MRQVALPNTFARVACVSVCVLFQLEIIKNAAHTHTHAARLQSRRSHKESEGCIECKMFVAQPESATWRMSDT